MCAFPITDALRIAAAIKAAPLPQFHDTVTRMLSQGTPELVWNKLISQMAAYYHGKWPTIGDSRHYHINGQKMVMAHPCIKQDGCNEWVCVN